MIQILDELVERLALVVALAGFRVVRAVVQVVLLRFALLLSLASLRCRLVVPSSLPCDTAWSSLAGKHRVSGVGVA